MDNKVYVNTNVLDDHRIEQYLLYDSDNLKNKYMHQILDLREQGVREALISMGWTPPEENE